MVDPYIIASKQIQNDGVPLAFALFKSKMHGFKKRAVLQILLLSQFKVLQQNTQDFSSHSVGRVQARVSDHGKCNQ